MMIVGKGVFGNIERFLSKLLAEYSVTVGTDMYGNTQRAVRNESDVIVLAELKKLQVWKKRVGFHLKASWFNRSIIQHFFYLKFYLLIMMMRCIKIDFCNNKLRSMYENNFMNREQD